MRRKQHSTLLARRTASRLFALICLSGAVCADNLAGSGKLLLTGGVTQLEGAAGGGLTPWAVIGGYGTRDQIGANAFYSVVDSGDYRLDSTGALLGLYDRVELSYAEQRFDTRHVGALLGLGEHYKLSQDIVGIKVKVAGDAVLDQGSWLPQLALGLQYKHNKQGVVVRAVGAKNDTGTDIYLSATKLLLAESLLLNGTLRATRANQTGILGFGGDKRGGYSAQLEGSAAWLLRRDLAVGAEYRSKPNNLGIAKEDDWYDLFLAWTPSKHVSLTLAYAELGNIVLKDRQKATYLSAKVGF